MMRLFLDTEFTDFIDCELISIGIVSDDGREFYAELNDFDMARCSEFVKETVLPLLGQDVKVVGNRSEVSTALLSWLAQFDDIEVCVDYTTDFKLFSSLVCDPDTQALPAGIRWHNIWNEIADIDIEQYWREKSDHRPHHALHDAWANRFAYLKATSQAR